MRKQGVVFGGIAFALVLAWLVHSANVQSSQGATPTTVIVTVLTCGAATIITFVILMKGRWKDL